MSPIHLSFSRYPKYSPSAKLQGNLRFSSKGSLKNALPILNWRRTCSSLIPWPTTTQKPTRVTASCNCFASCSFPRAGRIATDRFNQRSPVKLLSSGLRTAPWFNDHRICCGVNLLFNSRRRHLCVWVYTAVQYNSRWLRCDETEVISMQG